MDSDLPNMQQEPNGLRNSCLDLTQLSSKLTQVTVLSLITTPFSPYNLNPTATFKDRKINIHLCSKSPARLQGKYLDNNSFVCTLPFFLPSLFSLSLFCLVPIFYRIPKGTNKRIIVEILALWLHRTFGA